MAKPNKGWGNVLLGFGLLTVASGIYLIFQQDYVIGCSGSVVGVFLIYQRSWNINDQKGE